MNNFTPQYNGSYQPYMPQMNMQQVSDQYNQIMQQMNGQMQSLNERMSQIQNQFQQQYPQLFQQNGTTQNQAMSSQNVQSDVISCIPVTSYDEVKAQTPLPVGKRLFTNFKKGEMFTVYFDNDDNKVIDSYVKVDNTKPQNDLQDGFATVGDVDYLFNYIKGLEGKIEALSGGVRDDTGSDLEDNTEQPTDSTIVPAVARKSKPKPSTKSDDGK